MILDILIFAGTLVVCSASAVAVDPRAKVWLADTLYLVCRVLCSQLYARAKAQQASRTLYQQVYREEWSAGNWTPAASSASRETTKAAVQDASRGTAAFEQLLEAK